WSWRWSWRSSWRGLRRSRTAGYPSPPLRTGRMKVHALLLALTAATLTAAPAQHRERARDLGIPLEGTPGPLDAITDVAGVEVGHRTLIAGAGKLVVGKGPVRTGVTAVFPRGKASDDPVFAGWFAMNGNGEMTGTTWVEESGFLWGPGRRGQRGRRDGDGVQPLQGRHRNGVAPRGG